MWNSPNSGHICILLDELWNYSCTIVNLWAVFMYFCVTIHALLELCAHNGCNLYCDKKKWGRFNLRWVNSVAGPWPVPPPIFSTYQQWDWHTVKFHSQLSWRPHTDSSLHCSPGPPSLEMCHCHQRDSATHPSHPLFQMFYTATGS